jgi:hypothetical protein
MREFEDAMDMAKEGMERICELAEEMADLYGERRGGSYGSWPSYGSRGGYGMRGGYGGRGGYGEREEMDYDDMMMGERRRRDSRGRFM